MFLLSRAVMEKKVAARGDECLSEAPKTISDERERRKGSSRGSREKGDGEERKFK